MALVYVELEDRYKPKNPDNEITVSAKIGDVGDIAGAYIIFQDLSLKAVNQPAQLGKASSLIGKDVLISVTIPDVLEETNWTSVTIFVDEGGNRTTYGPYPKKLPNDLDTACYIIKIRFEE